MKTQKNYEERKKEMWSLFEEKDTDTDDKEIKKRTEQNFKSFVKNLKLIVYNANQS